MSKTKTIYSLLCSLVLTFYLMFFVPTQVLASDGIFELRSLTGDNARCFAVSLLMTNGRYKIVVSCVDLLYPPQPPDIFTYVVWATPIDGNRPVRLGELGVGKAQYEAGQQFSELFVSTEQMANVRSPSGNIVMRATAQPIAFLQRPTTPTPVPEKQPQGETPEQAESENLSTRDKLFTALRRAGIAALLALVAIIGLVFVITRSRG